MLQPEEISRIYEACDLRGMWHPHFPELSGVVLPSEAGNLHGEILLATVTEQLCLLILLGGHLCSTVKC